MVETRLLFGLDSDRVDSDGLGESEESNHMTNRLSPNKQGELIRVNLTKGAYLLLTWAEYVAGLKRGKQERRAEDLRRRAYAVEQQGDDCPRLIEK